MKSSAVIMVLCAMGGTAWGQVASPPESAPNAENTTPTPAPVPTPGVVYAPNGMQELQAQPSLNGTPPAAAEGASGNSGAVSGFGISQPGEESAPPPALPTESFQRSPASPGPGSLIGSQPSPGQIIIPSAPQLRDNALPTGGGLSPGTGAGLAPGAGPGVGAGIAPGAGPGLPSPNTSTTGTGPLVH